MSLPGNFPKKYIKFVFVNNVLKIKTVLTQNNLIKYWKLSIDMCQSSSASLLLSDFV